MPNVNGSVVVVLPFTVDSIAPLFSDQSAPHFWIRDSVFTYFTYFCSIILRTYAATKAEKVPFLITSGDPQIRTPSGDLIVRMIDSQVDHKRILNTYEPSKLSICSHLNYQLPKKKHFASVLSILM